MKLRFSYEDERGGIDFGEVEFLPGGWLHAPGEPPLMAARHAELEAEGGAGGEAGPWWSKLKVEVVE